MPSTLVTLLTHPDQARLSALLSEDVRFHSPVADYHGRADVAHLFTTIAGVLEMTEPLRVLAAGHERVTFLAGTAQGRPIDGVLDEQYDDLGRIVEVTLMLRPLSALHTAVRAMATALDTSPLPSHAVAESLLQIN